MSKSTYIVDTSKCLRQCIYKWEFEKAMSRMDKLPPPSLDEFVNWYIWEVRHAIQELRDIERDKERFEELYVEDEVNRHLNSIKGRGRHTKELEKTHKLVYRK